MIPDLGGLRSLAAVKPIKTPSLDSYLIPTQLKPPIVQPGAEGPDALQIP